MCNRESKGEKMKLIVTVGTSILDNNESDIEDIEDIEDQYFNELENYIEKLKKNIKSSIKNYDSAEISIIKKIYEQNPNLEVYLIATDTLPSYIAAEIINEYLNRKKNINSYFDESYVIKNLVVKSNDKFQDGVLNLIKKLYDISGGYFENLAISFNGGYKALIPYITIFAQLNRIPLYYLFEESNEIIKIPQAPIDIDWSIFLKYRKLIEKLYEGLDEEEWKIFKRENNLEELNDIIEKIEIDGKILLGLNLIGRMFYEEFKNFIDVYIYKLSSFMNENRGNKKEIEDAIRELYNRLKRVIDNNNIKTTDELLNYIKNLSDTDDLKHGGNLSHNYFIFKSTNRGQVRIIYTPEISGKDIILKVFDYKRGSFNHSTYIDEIRNKLKSTNLNNENFIYLPIRK